MNSFRSYLLKLATLTTALLLLSAGLNYIVDPFDLFDVFKIKGFNASKPESHSHARMIKAHKVRFIKPDAIILGSSRSETGLDPDHPGWGEQTKTHYNLALHSANIYEVYRYLQHAHENEPLKQVVIGLDFFMFSSNKQNEIDFDESRLSGYGFLPWGWYTDIFRSLLTYDALKASIDTLSHQRADAASDYAPNGFPDDSRKWTKIQKKGGHRGAAISSERYTLTAVDGFIFFNLFEDNSDISPKMQVFSQILDYCRKNGIDLRLILSPVHARRLVLLHQIGLWEEFESWKTQLVQAVERINPAAQLWDFTGFSIITTETFPELGDTDTQMNWYWESSHYKKLTGVRVLDIVLGRQQDSEQRFTDFGILLSSKNIEAHLQNQRQGLEQYIGQFPEQVAEIQTMIADTSNARETLYARYPKLIPARRF